MDELNDFIRNNCKELENGFYTCRTESVAYFDKQTNDFIGHIHVELDKSLLNKVEEIISDDIAKRADIPRHSINEVIDVKCKQTIGFPQCSVKIIDKSKADYELIREIIRTLNDIENQSIHHREFFIEYVMSE